MKASWFQKGGDLGASLVLHDPRVPECQCRELGFSDTDAGLVSKPGCGSGMVIKSFVFQEGPYPVAP